MNKALLVGSLLVLLISAILLPNAFSKYKTYKTGQLVIITLLKLPDCSSGYKNKFLKLQYKSSNYVQRTACKYIKNLHSGQQIQMLHRENTSDFLFPNEDVFFELISIFLLGFTGIAILIIALRKIRKEKLQASLAE